MKTYRVVLIEVHPKVSQGWEEFCLHHPGKVYINTTDTILLTIGTDSSASTIPEKFTYIQCCLQLVSCPAPQKVGYIILHHQTDSVHVAIPVDIWILQPFSDVIL